jgi:hypothetical protein
LPNVYQLPKATVCERGDIAHRVTGDLSEHEVLKVTKEAKVIEYAEVEDVAQITS